MGDNKQKFDLDELIVVEGKNDAHAIRKALGKVDVIWTEGFGLTKEKLKYIREMARRRGVIVCTDPDFVGKLIRDKISRLVPGAKHVYLSRNAAKDDKGDDIGVENASPQEIREAFSRILVEKAKEEKAAPNLEFKEYCLDDLVETGLAGKAGAGEKRAALGKILGLGEANAKQFLHRLNRFGISREEFARALKEIEGKD